MDHSWHQLLWNSRDVINMGSPWNGWRPCICSPLSINKSMYVMDWRTRSSQVDGRTHSHAVFFSLQVQNFHSCIQVTQDFVSPEHLVHSFHLTQELRSSKGEINFDDKLQVRSERCVLAVSADVGKGTLSFTNDRSQPNLNTEHKQGQGFCMKRSPVNW